LTMTYWHTKLHVLQWAKEKGLLEEGNQHAQMCKVTEEVGELAGAILKKDEEGIRDAFGDVLVTLVILAKQMGVDETECFAEAYEVIKDRKGKLIDGSFVKD